METSHQLFFKDARHMPEVADGSVNLVVTSPPYPMIGMWDGLFRSMSPRIGKALDSGDGAQACELMHRELDQVWAEVDRVTAPSGLVCVNVGDAVRKTDGTFRLYANHMRIARFFQEAGYNPLPQILWRKPSNKPNKFMGSGMLPPNAYVTLEHEHILIFRRGDNRSFSRDELWARRRSAYFWEERNAWFSDVWTDLQGVPQQIGSGRGRSAAYPLELPYRLINMYSVQGDLVLDPFLGTGTTTYAAMAAARRSIGYEIDAAFRPGIESKAMNVMALADDLIADRLRRHARYMGGRQRNGGPVYRSARYGFEVVTAQEREIFLPRIETIRKTGLDGYAVTYRERPG